LVCHIKVVPISEGIARTHLPGKATRADGWEANAGN